jgi:hypothetical protein
MQRKDITKLVHDMVIDGKLPAKILAKNIGKPYSTLLRELNPFDRGAKLGVETFMEIIRNTENVEPLKAMAEDLGYTLVPRKDDQVRIRRKQDLPHRLTA